MASNTQDGVAALWQTAIDNYNSNPDLKSLTDLPRVDTSEKLVKLSEVRATGFQTERERSKLSWLRTKVKSCLGPIDSIAKYLAGAASTTFPPASAVYTVLSYLIDTTKKVTKDYDTVEDFFSKMEEFLTRLSILKDDVPKEVVLQKHLVKILESFLTLCGIATTYIDGNHFKRFLSNLLSKDGDKKLAEAYNKMLHLVDEESRIVENTILQIVQEISTNVKYNINISLRGADIAGRIEMLLLDERAKLESEKQVEEYDDILLWLLSNDPLDKYQDILSRRRGEGTGGWLLVDSKFTEWLSKADKTLWCPGKAGAGKTMLATIIVEHLFSLHEPSKGSVGIACVYLSYKDNHTLQELLFSILKQLIQRRKAVPEKVIDTYKSYKGRKTRPSKGEILEMLQCEVDSLTDTFVVVDALDECSHEVRVALCNELENLQPKIHLLVTSRKIGAIADTLKGSETLEISAHPQDIRAFIKAQIEDPKNYRLKEIIKQEPKLEKEIVDAVIARAQGMFLLAGLHIESLASRLNEYEVRNALKDLPETVDASYDLALERIDKNPFEGHRDFSYKVFSWVAYSFRPLTVDELLCALAVDPGDSKFNTSKVSLKNDIVDLCAGLVIIDQISDVVRLVHTTMQTYFNKEAVRNDSRFKGRMATMADICLTCLSFNMSDGQDDSDDDSDDDTDGDADGDSDGDSDDDGSHPPRSPAGSTIIPTKADPYDSSQSHDLPSDNDPLSPNSYLADVLKDYAVRYWGEHARRDSEQSEKCHITLMATDFLCHTARRKALAQDMYWIGMLATTVKVTGLHIAAKLGLTAVAKALLAKDCDIDARDGHGNSALAIAIESDREEVVNLLVDAGAFIDLQELSGLNMLIIAAEKDYQHLANRILQEADAATPQAALLAAAYNGQHTKLARILERPDLDLMGKHESFGVTALLIGVERGTLEVVRALLERGVDVGAPGGNGAAPPALHRAAGRGHIKIVKLLFKYNALVDSRDREDKTAWTYSVKNRQKKISNLLKKAGADPNTKGAMGVSELYNYACNGDIEGVRYMLESGTDPSIETNFGWAPLHWSAEHGSYEIVKLLLEYRAYPSPLSDQIRTPLSMAIDSERWKVVDLLKEAGAKLPEELEVRFYESEDMDDATTLDGDEQDPESD